MIDSYRCEMWGTVVRPTDIIGGFAPYPELMTENELVLFLRIAEVSSSRDHHNVIEHLKRYRNLPRIRICNKVLYPTQAIRRWIRQETIHSN